LPVLICCDHASNAIPKALGKLGLPERSLSRHIAWDIGAAELARRLADRLEVQAILAGYSRLVIDCNRQFDDPTSIAELSDGEAVPGNQGLTAEQRAERARCCFWPYQNAVATALEELQQRVAQADIAPRAAVAGPSTQDASGKPQSAPVTGCAPALIAVHSFTPLMHGGTPRPWHCGVLWNFDPRIALPLIQALRQEPGLVVGDNEPYSGRYPAGFTIDMHAERRGWPSVSLEIRQDLIADPEGAIRWAERLSQALGPVLADPLLFRVESAYKTVTSSKGTG
jgi:predicted N-formylglutamate amidohydrolase